MSALTDPIGGMLDRQVAAARGMTDAEALRFLATGELPDLSRPPDEVTEAPAETAGSEQVRSLGDATLLLANITPLTSSSRTARYDEILSSNVITAAGWKAEAHPRDRHGRFIEKGAVADLLGMKNPTAQHLLDAVAELDPKKWSDLKPAQRKQIADRVAELPAGLRLADPARAKMKKLVGVPEAPKAPKASKTPAVTSTKTAAKKVAVPRGAGGPVVPASIYKKNPDGHVVAESPDGDARLRWDADAKKYVAEKRDGDGWKTEKTLTKAAAYEDVKDPTRWVTPGGQTAKTSNIGTKTEASSPPLAPEPTPPVVEPTAKSANTSHAGELAHEAYWDKYGDQYRAVKADEKQRGAIEAYTSGGFGTMNGIARGDQSIIGDPEIEDELAQWDEAIAGLDSFVRKQPPLHEDVTLFRGVGGEHVPESGEWREKGFTSASWSRPFAENWAEDENVPTLVELRLAKGQPAWVTAPGPESEVILPLDTRYRVISSEVTNGRRHVVAEVVDHPRAAAPSEVAAPASAPPSAVTKPKAPEASVAEPGGPATPTLPDQVEFNPPMYGDGTLITTHQAADRQRAIDELRTKPTNFDPNAPVQSGASAFYAALNSAALTPVTKRGDAESKAAATYQDNVAFAWNDLLRHGTKPKKLSDAIKIKNNQPALDALLDRSKLPHAIQVHRGLGDPDGSLLAQLKPGAVFEDRGYVSTTTEKAVAEHFVDKGAIMLDVEVPAGSRAIVPSRWSTTDLDEREVLLPRGSRFEVVGQPTKVDGVTHVKVRAVTDVPSAASLPAATPTTAPATPKKTPGDKLSAYDTARLGELDTTLDYFAGEAKAHAQADAEVNHKAGIGAVLTPADIQKSDKARKALAELVDNAREYAFEKLDILAKRDGEPWSEDDPGAARWVTAGQPHSVTDPKVNKDKLQKARDSYVVNDKKTIEHNASLRSEDPTTAAKSWRSRMNNMVKSGTLTHDSTVYRGAALPPDAVNRLRPGAVLRDPGIMSTAETQGDAQFYVKTRSDRLPGTIPVIFKVRVPGGTKSADVGYGEYVFGSDTALRVVSSKREGDQVYVTVDMLTPQQVKELSGGK